MQEIIDLARRASVPVRFEPRHALDRLAGTSAHQGVVALGAAKKYADLDSAASSELVVVLDGVEDPHNLGAIIRTAHAAGRRVGDYPGAARGGRDGRGGESRGGSAGAFAGGARH